MAMSREPDELVRTLRELGAVGRSAAVPQRLVARRCGWTTRELQLVSAAANGAGMPVVTACDAPAGMYLAETIDELRDYESQLMSRLRGNAGRALSVRRIVRRWREADAVDPISGQRCLPLGEAVMA